MLRTCLLLLSAVVLLIARPLAAQDNGDHQGVRQAVLDYVEGFYEGDTTRLVRSVWPEVRKYGYWQSDANGPYSGEPMPYAEFMSFANGVRTGEHQTPANAPKEIEIYDVQDQTASAKLTAWWGTDYVLLAREEGRWMIIAVVWQGPLRS